MPNVWYFGDSRAAYDNSQCSEFIQDGDLLVVPSEKATAIMVDAWPIICDGYDEDCQHSTKFDGPLHHSHDWYSLEGGKYVASIEMLSTISYEGEHVFFPQRVYGRAGLLDAQRAMARCHVAWAEAKAPHLLTSWVD